LKLNVKWDIAKRNVQVELKRLVLGGMSSLLVL